MSYDEEQFAKMMESAQKMQMSMQKAHEELSTTEITAKAGTDDISVTLTMNGRYGVSATTISEGAYNEGKDVLQDLVTAAFNDGVRRIEQLSEEKMRALSEGLGIPANDSNTDS